MSFEPVRRRGGNTPAGVGAVWIVGSWRGYGRRTVPEVPTPAAYA